MINKSLSIWKQNDMWQTYKQNKTSTSMTDTWKSWQQRGMRRKRNVYGKANGETTSRANIGGRATKRPTSKSSNSNTHAVTIHICVYPHVYVCLYLSRLRCWIRPTRKTRLAPCIHTYIHYITLHLISSHYIA